MSTETESAAGAVINAGMGMAADYLLDQLCCAEPSAARWSRTLDCGTMRVRIRVEVEPTGLTAEQAAAEAIASDPAETPEVRAAARAVLAGGPGLGEAVALLSRTGPWPGP